MRYVVTYRKKSQFRKRSYVGKGNRFNKTFGRYGFHHEYRGSVELQMEDGNANTFIIPLLAMDKTMSNADSVYVNPHHSSYSSSNDHLTYGGSVVKKMHVGLDILMPPAGQESGIWGLKVETMPICIRYDDLTKEANGDVVSSFIPCVEHGSDEKIRPAWDGNDLTGEDLYDSDGLTTDATPENVPFNKVTFETALAESPLSSLLRSITQGGLRQFMVRREFPMMTYRTYQVPKKVQLQTEHTFYGVLVHVPQAFPNGLQMWDSDETTDIDHLRMNWQCSFFEFNKEFNQGIS